MNLDQLGQQFEANKGPILATAAVAVGVFAFVQKRKAGAAPAAAAGPAPTPGYVSAGGQVAGMGGYDSSASDVYGLVQPQLEALGGQLNGLNAKLNTVPVSQSPIASSLYAPKATGTYLRYGNLIGEVESDGSLYSLSYPEWAKLESQGATFQQVGARPADMPKAWTGAGNIAATASQFSTPGTETRTS